MSAGHVVILGARSQIGVFAIARLAAAGMKVWAVSRQPRPQWYPAIEGVTWVSEPGRLSAHGRHARYMVSAGPVGLAADWLEAGVLPERLVLISTTSLFSKANSPDAAERGQMQAIAAAEARLLATCAQRDVQWCILRPTLIYGCGMDRNISLLARFIERFGFLPLSRGATGLRQPVHADDVSQAAIAALFEADAGSLESPLCGGSTLSFRVMAERIFAGLGRTCRIIEVPELALIWATALADVVAPAWGVRPAMVHRQSTDLVFDDVTARRVLGWEPRRFRPARPDFDLPSPVALRELARPTSPPLGSRDAL